MQFSLSEFVHYYCIECMWVCVCVKLTEIKMKQALHSINDSLLRPKRSVDRFSHEKCINRINSPLEFLLIFSVYFCVIFGCFDLCQRRSYCKIRRQHHPVHLSSANCALSSKFCWTVTSRIFLSSSFTYICRLVFAQNQVNTIYFYDRELFILVLHDLSISHNKWFRNNFILFWLSHFIFMSSGNMSYEVTEHFFCSFQLITCHCFNQTLK